MSSLSHSSSEGQQSLEGVQRSEKLAESFINFIAIGSGLFETDSLQISLEHSTCGYTKSKSVSHRLLIAEAVVASRQKVFIILINY